MKPTHTPSHGWLTLALAVGLFGAGAACGDEEDAKTKDSSAERDEESGDEESGDEERSDEEDAKDDDREAEQDETDSAKRNEAASDGDVAKAELDADSKFCGVLQTVRSECQRCHAETPVGGAPMALVTYDDFMADGVTDPKRKVYELVRDRVHDDKRPMPPPPAQLTSDQLAELDAWVDAGALEPAETCPEPDPALRPSEDEMVWPEDCEEWYTFAASDRDDPSKPYMIPANTEEHPSWRFDTPWGDDEVHLLATRPVTDNAKVLHHWILWDTQGPSSLAGWAPGGIPDELPDDVGLYMPKGEDVLLLDMHYYNLNGDKPEPDRSGVEVCITRTLRPKTAANVGLNGSATVAANARAETPVACEVQSDEEIRFLGINPHMHQLGVHAKLELTRDGETTVLWDAPFAFTEQEMHALDNVKVQNGDILTTTCTFVNDKPIDVSWGDGTDDEMCINWIRYYPQGAFRCQRMQQQTQPDPATEPSANTEPDSEPEPEPEPEAAK